MYRFVLEEMLFIIMVGRRRTKRKTDRHQTSLTLNSEIMLLREGELSSPSPISKSLLKIHKEHSSVKYTYIDEISL